MSYDHIHPSRLGMQSNVPTAVPTAAALQQQQQAAAMFAMHAQMAAPPRPTAASTLERMGIADLSGAAPYPAGYVPSAQPKKKKDEKKRLSSSASSSTALPPRPLFGQSAASSSASTLYSMPKNKVNSGKVTKKKILRAAGGEVWEDESMLEWDPNDFRLFCGDLGNEVGDELLTRTFSKYPSFVKAKIVRDKKTTKSKGYGFVSFKDPNDFVAALKEMDGKYVGNRPIKLRKSTWEDRSVEMKNLRKVVTGGLVKK